MLSVVALVISIVGILVSLIPFANLFTLFIPLVGIVLGALATHFSDRKGMAVASIILGVLGLAVSAAVMIWVINFLS